MTDGLNVVQVSQARESMIIDLDVGQVTVSVEKHDCPLKKKSLSLCKHVEM